MTSFGGAFGTERGFVFRPPSTANLMVDAADRPNQGITNPYDFQITRQQSLFNGAFTRVATTEVVLEWCQDNVSAGTVGVDISGVAHTFNMNAGIYTVAELLDDMVASLDGLNIPAYNFQVYNAAGTVTIYSGNDNLVWSFTSDTSGIIEQLDMPLNVSDAYQFVGCPDLRPHRYIDFTSSQLTYPQDLKDASTQLVSRDVLCRWYFAEDSPENLDTYGFPILMGYTRFTRRRLFNPPKYIKWDNNLPVGNLSFQVYDENGNILAIPNEPDRNNWLMTLQLSEN